MFERINTPTYFTVTPFDTDSNFTMRAIDRLKASAGISLIEELGKHMPTAFVAVAKDEVQNMYNHILIEWASGHGSHPTHMDRAVQSSQGDGLE